MSPKDVALRGDTVTSVDVATVQTLDLETIENEAEPALIARGAAYAREYARIEDKPAILAMNIAVVMLALRRRYGDMAGRSYEYRKAATEVYSQAGVTGDQLSRLKTNVRYHMGNALRRVLTPRELKALGYIEDAPVERQRDRRATDRALLSAVSTSRAAHESTPAKPSSKAAAKTAAPAAQVSSAGLTVRATADHLRLAEVAAGLVGELDTDVIDEHMTDGQRAKLDELLAQIEKQARRLRRHMKKPRSGG